MRYTIREGVERPFSENVKRSFRYVLPLVVILAGVLFLALNPGSGRKSPRPLTLGIYTVKTNDNNSTAAPNKPNNKGSGSQSSGTASTPALSGDTGMAAITPVSASTSLGAAPSAPTSTGGLLTGGMGGGTGGTDTGGDSGGTVTPPATSSATFPCVDITSGLSVSCTYTTCTPPLNLTGHKSYISTTGQCVTIN